MKTQLEFLKDAVKLAEANPDIEIHIAADSDELSEEFGWTDHRITSVEKSIYCCYNEKIITDIDELIEYLEDTLDKDVTEEEALKETKQVILIRTGKHRFL